MMKDPVTKAAFERAILATIHSLYALAIDSADVMSVRIEYSSSMKMLNVIIFSATTTEHAHNIVLLDNEQALKDLLAIEDDLIERIAARRDELDKGEAA
ncbi:hypothetical protein [Vibrio fluvialis]|uniref:hypothetical protein n=1 Tax=Vibrio fluvialis TaxID=676 RepID=UPI001558D7AA|nr:hypothetical protein [Vibrio fluvialis]ELL9328540.1 hypothetical protein [Vibrio fluvialis]ELV8552511.1 hypothetical protein [Vibrio fluvialis]MBY8291005.1 hypothetical protein [Vibrio fluvialis]